MTDKLKILKHKMLPKKPEEKDFPPLKHTWKLDEYGNIDDFAYDNDTHNGPSCVKCNYSGCHHCEPEMYDDTSCAFDQALSKYYQAKIEVEVYNSHVDFYNKQIEV